MVSIGSVLQEKDVLVTVWEGTRKGVEETTTCPDRGEGDSETVDFGGGGGVGTSDAGGGGGVNTSDVGGGGTSVAVLVVTT